MLLEVFLARIVVKIRIYQFVIDFETYCNHQSSRKTMFLQSCAEPQNLAYSEEYQIQNWTNPNHGVRNKMRNNGVPPGYYAAKG